MAIKVIDDKYLVDIADAIREKSGTTDTYTPAEMAGAITNLPSGGGSGGEMKPIVLTGNCSYACSGAIATNYLKNYGNTVSTNKITNASNMF